MYNSNFSRNPWANYTNLEPDLDELKKAIREHKVLLSALTGVEENNIQQYSSAYDSISIEELKERIINISKELSEKQYVAAYRAHSTQTPAQWWSRYELNLRQLEDLADQRHTLLKEIDYLTKSIGVVQEDLLQETEKLNKLSNKIKPSNYTTLDSDHLSDSERIREKAQAMVAARLKRHNYSTPTLSNHSSLNSDVDINAKLTYINQLMDRIYDFRATFESIMDKDLNHIDQDLSLASKDVKERQMFEKGLYIDHQVARFIDQLDKITYTPSAPPPVPPPLYSSYSSNYAPPPPVPTSQRPGTPRSADSIKAEAYRRIEARKQLFIKDTTKRAVQNNVSTTKVTEEEKAAQLKMKQAEADARARLEALREKRNKLRQEAAEAEEKKKQAAAEAAAIAEAEMLAEKKRKQLEEEERLAKIKKAQEELDEKQQKVQQAEAERLRLEMEEKLRLETEEKLKREEEERLAQELRQKKAKQAAEQAAREKRMRRVEQERREKEIEAAKQEEINRRKQWEEAERQKHLEEERKLKEKEEEALRIKKRIEEEQARIEEQKKLEEEERRRREEEEERKRQEEEEERKRLEEENELAAKRAVEEHAKTLQTSTKSHIIQSPSIQHNTTAGTSGYGVDVEDEVNFSIIYRVNTLYEYQGIRVDDLSFLPNETLKAHPSKDKGSDWWYGTSLSTNQVGFFPRTYVEVVEEAFRVRTLYQFKKMRDDDLGFLENEVIVVQPFQDENSDWWYGTIEGTEESGYFPKTYVEKIDAAKNIYENTLTVPIHIQSHHNHNDNELPRGLSAPNTPIMKKTNLGVNKVELTKRRRAASNVSTVSNSHISTPKLIIPHSDTVSDNLELLTWASTMDPIELEAIPMDERKRQEAIFELITTERTYLNDLQMIINVFYIDSGKYLLQDEKDVVFSNIDDLMICNTALLSDMESRQREGANVVDKIGDVFLKHAESLQCYSSYCRNQSYATKFLQKKRQGDQWFEVFLKTAQTRPECRSLDLSHFLLQPVQRITRYPLLLRQILNCTPKKHADYALVRSALSIAQKVLEDVNEETRRFENIQKMSELTRIIDMEANGRLDISGRELVMDGVLYKAKSGRKLHGFLFNDILILAEPLKQLNSKGYLYTLYREPIPIERLSVRQQQPMNTMFSSNSGNSSNTDDMTFQIVSGNQVIAVKTSTVSQKRQWMSQIQHYSAYQSI